MTSPPQNLAIAIPVVAGVGNALMAVPMVRQIKRHMPETRILIVARLEAMAEPFRRLREVDEVFVMGNGLRGTIRGTRWMRRRKPDVFLVPFPSNRWQYNLLAFASGAGRAVMHGYPAGRLRTLAFLPAQRVPAQRGIHDVSQNLRLLRCLGIEPDESGRPEFLLNDMDRARAAGLLGAIGLSDGASFIAVHAGSAKTVLAQAKRWPPQRYAELIAALRREWSHEVVLLEGPDEAGVADEIMTPSPSPLSTGERREARVLRLTGPLGDAAAVLERAALYVGSDSGLAHLAAAVGTPALTLFAPADPNRVCPFGYRHLVVQPPRDCAPCFLYPWQATRPKMRCREPMCITLIEVDAVMTAVREALNG